LGWFCKRVWYRACSIRISVEICSYSQADCPYFHSVFLAVWPILSSKSIASSDLSMIFEEIRVDKYEISQCNI
jgi:hypothetical protein